MANQSHVLVPRVMRNHFVHLQDVLALSAFRCRAFSRSLMYIEVYLQANPETEQRNLGFLQVIHCACMFIV